jgi:hypothetical protein
MNPGTPEGFAFLTLALLVALWLLAPLIEKVLPASLKPAAA